MFFPSRLVLQGVFGEDGGFKVPDLPTLQASGVRGASTVRSVAGDLPRIPPTFGGVSGANPAVVASVATSAATGNQTAATSTTAVRVPVGVGLNKHKATLVQPSIQGVPDAATAVAAKAATATTGKAVATPGTAGKDGAMDEEYEEDDEFIDEPYGYSEYYEEDYS